MTNRRSLTNLAKKGDTGSPEVQAALLSLKIDKLAEHLEINKKIIILDVVCLRLLLRGEGS